MGREGEKEEEEWRRKSEAAFLGRKRGEGGGGGRGFGKSVATPSLPRRWVILSVSLSLYFPSDGRTLGFSADVTGRGWKGREGGGGGFVSLVMRDEEMSGGRKCPLNEIGSFIRPPFPPFP